MFNVNNKDTKTRSPSIVGAFVNLANFTCRSSACIFDFKHVLRTEYVPLSKFPFISLVLIY